MNKKIIRYLIGGLFVLVALSSIYPFEPSSLVVSLIIVVACFYREVMGIFHVVQHKKIFNGKAVYKTYTLEPTGSLHACIYPNAKRNRQETIAESRPGDSVTVRKYEWNGEDAVMFINDRTGYDIGVAQKGKDLSSMLVYLKGYDVIGKIINTHDFIYKGNTYKGCRIEISCYEK